MHPRSKVAALGVVCLALSTAAFAQASAFYGGMLSRGVADALTGDANRALRELRIAAFGLLDSIPDYETAQVHIATVCQRLGMKDEAALAVLRFNEAERISPSYAQLSIDAGIRRTFDALRAELAVHPLTVRPHSATPLPAPTLPPAAAADPAHAPQPATPQPQRAASPAPWQATTPKVVRPINTTPQPPPDAPEGPQPAVVSPQTPSPAPVDPVAANLQLAREHLNANDDAGARLAARKVLDADPNNATAHEILGVVAAHMQQWPEVINHFSDLRTRRKLTDDENAMLFVAYVNTGSFADARAARQQVKPASMSWPPAEAAARLLDAHDHPAAPAVTNAAHTADPSRPASNTATPVPHQVAAPDPPAPSTPSPQQPPPKSTAPASTTTRPAPPAARPAAPQASTQQPIVSPLVAASRHKPSEHTSNPNADLQQAQQLLNEGKLIAARQLFISLSELELPRATTLAVARGLNQTSAYRESSVEYYKAQPFQKGEELHMFTEAVNRYELGDLKTARELLARALPGLELTRDVALYKARIEAAR